LQARVRAARPETVHDVDVERQRLKLDHDLFDRFRGGQFIDGGDGENRLAFVHRLHRQRALALRRGHDVFTERRAGLRARQIIGRQDRLHARHRQRGTNIEVRHTRVRHGAEEELREKHPVGLPVLRVPRLARDFRHEVGSRVVLTD